MVSFNAACIFFLSSEQTLSLCERTFSSSSLCSLTCFLPSIWECALNFFLQMAADVDGINGDLELWEMMAKIWSILIITTTPVQACLDDRYQGYGLKRGKITKRITERERGKFAFNISDFPLIRSRDTWKIEWILDDGQCKLPLDRDHKIWRIICSYQWRQKKFVCKVGCADTPNRLHWMLSLYDADQHTILGL